MNSTVPISPPVTPKGHNSIEYRKELPKEDIFTLPPTIMSPDLRRKSNIRKFNRSSVTPDKDVITFKSSFMFSAAHMKSVTTHHKKSIPQKSPSPSTPGSFKMNIVQNVLLSVQKTGVQPEKENRIDPPPSPLSRSSELSNKRRNDQLEETEVESPIVHNQSLFSTHSILNTERHVKKSKTDAAAAYDKVDITIPDEIMFKDDPKWIPNMKVFEKNPYVKVIWKGSPLDIQKMPGYELLHPGEVHIASTLRLTPEQYLKCKRALILAAQEFYKVHVNFRKSDAQKCVRIDVNKTSSLWNVFNQLGWFNPF